MTEQRGRLKTAGSPYESATAFNWRELALMLILGLVFLLPLPIVWVALISDSWTGLDLDTFKLIHGTEPAELLPSGIGFGPPFHEENRVSVEYSGGAVAQVNIYSDHRAAVRAWRSVWLADELPAGLQSIGTVSGSGKYLIRGRTTDSRSGEVNGSFVSWVNGPYEFWLFGGNKQKLDHLIEASPMIDAPSEPTYGTGPRPFIWTLMDKHPWLFALIIEIMVLVFMWAVLRFGLMLGRRSPPKGSARISRDELKERLLALNHADSPFEIQQLGANHLVCRWRLDEQRFFDLLSVEKVKELYQLDLYLRPWGSVAVLETRGRIEWLLSAAGPAARYQWSYSRGLVLADFRFQRDYVFDPLKLQFNMQERRFDAAAYKRPISEAVLASGWVWQPILFKPLLGR